MKLQALKKAAEFFSGKIEGNIYPENHSISSDGSEPLEINHNNK